MGKPASSGMNDRPTLQALNRRAEDILKARPAYREMVDFYLTVFRRQIEWRDRLVVQPEEVTAEQARDGLCKGSPLAHCFDPGIDSQSVLDLYIEMKAVFRRGNEVLRQAMDKLDDAEKAGGLAPASWLLEQRPDRPELVAAAAAGIGVEESVLAALARAVTFPHWELAARAWLSQADLEDWKGSRCPVCGGLAALGELRKERKSAAENLNQPSVRRLHCAFCGTRWAFSALECPSCGSVKSGDAKYLFTPNEPELRIDFCESCHHYVKVVDGTKVSGPIHVGLELLTTAHLDDLARDKNLLPLETCA
jgi:FdhE protein